MDKSELKTLKDLEIEDYAKNCTGSAFYSKNSKVTTAFEDLTREEQELYSHIPFADKIRQEAIKWIKHLKDCEHCNDGDKIMDNEPEITLLKHFFNITEEDLENAKN